MTRILLLSLEYAEPVFSGNGVLARTLVRALSKYAQDQIMVICGQPQGKQVVPKGGKEHEFSEQVEAITLSKWYKLDWESSWEEYGSGVEKSMPNVLTFNPQVVLGIDWTSHKALKTLRNVGLSESIPFIFLNFRVFSQSNGISQEEKKFYEQKESQCMKDADMTVALCHNDARILRERYEGVFGTEFRKPVKVVNPPLREPIVIQATEQQEQLESRIGTSLAATAAKRQENETSQQADGDTVQFKYISRSQLTKRTYITCCCRLTPEKRVKAFVDIMIHAAPFLKQNGYIPFLVGPPTNATYAQELTTKIKQFFPGDQSIVVSEFVPVEQLAAVFRRTILNVHPATYEAYGMSIAEAAAFGAPTLMDGGGGIGCADLLPAPQMSFYTDMNNVKLTSSLLKTILRPEGGSLLDVVRQNARACSIAWDTEAYGEAVQKCVSDVLGSESSRESGATAGREKATTQSGMPLVHDSVSTQWHAWLRKHNFQVGTVEDIDKRIQSVGETSLYDVAAAIMNRWNQVQASTRQQLELQGQAPSPSQVRVVSREGLKERIGEEGHQELLRIGLALLQVSNDRYKDQGSRMSRLEQARFRLVPSTVPEDAFWVILSHLVAGPESAPAPALSNGDAGPWTSKVSRNLSRELSRIVQQDPGERGIDPLIEAAGRDELLAIANAIADSTHTVIISGFPCCESADPHRTTPQESDGPAGAVAIARAAAALGNRVTILVETVNASPFHASAQREFIRRDRVSASAHGTALSHYDTPTGRGAVVIEEVPVGSRWTSALALQHRRVLLDQLEREGGHVLAIERAGPSADGQCKTMRARVLDEEVLAPLHELFAAAHSSGRVKTSCIGDGGNELGMGRDDVMQAIHANVAHGPEIACVLPSHHTFVCGVSNWGGYAVAAAVGAVAMERKLRTGGVEEVIEEFLGSPESVVASIVASIEEGGARDGVTGSMNPPTVDGLSLDHNHQVVQSLINAMRSEIS